MKRKPLRSINRGPKSAPATARCELYKRIHDRINEALAAKFYLEVIALCESIIADRSEARLAAIHSQADHARTFSTAGSLSRKLCEPKLREQPDAVAIYKSITAWADQRNAALHRMVKVGDEWNPTWLQRQDAARQAATSGIAVVRKVENLVKRLNRHRCSRSGEPPIN